MIYHRFERFTYYKPPAMPEVVDFPSPGGLRLLEPTARGGGDKEEGAQKS
jgi:hypothetical protein